MPTVDDIAPQVFDRHFKEASAYLSAYGNDPLERGQGIAHWYYETARKTPHIAWFSTVALGSVRVNAVLAASKALDNGEDLKAKTLYQGSSEGNETAFKNIFATYHTYIELGSQGIQSLAGAEHGAINSQAVRAFLAIDTIHTIQNRGIVKDLSNYWYFKYTDKLDHYQMEAGTAKVLKEISVAFTTFEQSLLQEMYGRSYVKGGPTLAEVLNDSVWTARLDDALGLKFPFKVTAYQHGDIGDIENRMSFFKEGWDSYFEEVTQKGGLARHEAVRNKVPELLEVAYIEPTVIYDYAVDPRTMPHPSQWKGPCESIGVSQAILNAVLEREEETLGGPSRSIFQLEDPTNFLNVPGSTFSKEAYLHRSVSLPETDDFVIQTPSLMHNVNESLFPVE